MEGLNIFIHKKYLSQYDFEARTLIPQVGLFTTPDPQAGVYPWLNPYLYCAANPIRYIDPTGKDFRCLDGNDEYRYANEDNKIAVYDLENNLVSQTSLSNIHQNAIQVLNKLLESSTGKTEISNIINSDEIVRITYNDIGTNMFSESGKVQFDPYKTTGGISYNEFTGSYDRSVTPDINLSHELGHAEDWVRGTLDNRIWIKTSDGQLVGRSEISACNRENQYRHEIGVNQRVSYLSIFNGYQYFPDISTSFKIQYIYNMHINNPKNYR